MRRHGARAGTHRCRPDAGVPHFGRKDLRGEDEHDGESDADERLAEDGEDGRHEGVICTKYNDQLHSWSDLTFIADVRMGAGK